MTRPAPSPMSKRLAAMEQAYRDQWQRNRPAPEETEHPDGDAHPCEAESLAGTAEDDERDALG
jgi:hypothetical protein